MRRWRCPGCGKKQRKKEMLTLGHCKNCERVHKIGDFYREICEIYDICNDSEKCDDDDWKNCGTYVTMMRLFNGGMQTVR